MKVRLKKKPTRPFIRKLPARPAPEPKTSTVVLQAQRRDSTNKDLWADVFDYADVVEARDAMCKLMAAGGNLRYRVSTIHEEG